ncbi:hypothetical protein HHI36_021118 [Cryptolaemus montrouzieri]|uniref:C2H2-type domain-containing protein n=1 Tax=Cryptolaemus montrouzieri TaxID=559131 RepID=A0ABD2MWS8_9CUCU
MNNKTLLTRTKIICRFCLQVVDKAISLSENIRSPDGSHEITLYTAVADVVPELSSSVQSSTMACNDCIEKLASAFFFRKLCLKTEMEISNFAHRKGQSGASVRLCDLLLEKLTNSMKMEEQEEIEDMRISDFKSVENTSDVPEIEDIIGSIPEIDDVKDVPDLIDLNNLADFVSLPESHTKEASVPKNPLFKVVPAQPYVLKEILLYPCKFCNRALKTLSLLEKHMSSHVILQNECAPCPRCKFVIPNRLEQIHLSLHGNSLTCSFCKYKMDSKTFVKHMKLHYPQSYGANPVSKLCGICYHSFPMAFFRVHLESHRLGVPLVSSNNLKCQICSDVFDFWKLEEHMMVHQC